MEYFTLGRLKLHLTKAQFNVLVSTCCISQVLFLLLVFLNPIQNHKVELLNSTIEHSARALVSLRDINEIDPREAITNEEVLQLGLQEYGLKGHGGSQINGLCLVDRPTLKWSDFVEGAFVELSDDKTRVLFSDE